MAVTSRDSLDKNGSYLADSVMDRYAWAGASTMWNNVNYGTGTVGTWSQPMKKKFTPKPIRKGWRN